MPTVKPETLPHDARGYPMKPKPYGVWKDGILWNNSAVGELVDSYSESVHTIYDLVNESFGKFSTRNAVGQRDLIKREFLADPSNPEGKKFEKLTLGEYRWLTYGEWQERISNFGSGLVALADAQAGDRMLIYAETQRDWMTSCLAAYSQSMSVVTAYATLGADAAAYAINMTDAKIVVADSKLLPILAKVHSQCKSISTVVTITEPESKIKEQLEAANIKVLYFEDVVAKGKENQAPHKPPKPDDTAVIMFTSGTTGNPKGVVILHKNVIAAMAGLKHAVGDLLSEEDVYMAYLPLAHIMEMVAELCQLGLGISLGYGSPHTLTNTGVKLAEGQTGDIVVLQPTVVVFAPLVLEKIYNSIQAKVQNASGLKKWLFDFSLKWGVENFEKGVLGAPSLLDKIVFKSIQAIAGSRVRIILTGSAPLDGNVHRFVQTCFNCPVRQGYGATETCAASVVQEINDHSVSSVGPPRVSACIKLVDWEEGGYRTSDKENPEIGKPRGEIVIGGPAVTAGYLENAEYADADIEEKNRTDFKEEDGIRWFYTGDIGEVDAEGCIKIIDRKKDLVKLQQGEYVALSKVEGVLKLSPFVDNALCHASSDQKYCTALICPSEAEVSKYAQAHNISGSVEELYANEDIKRAVLDSCQQAARGKLANFETPQRVHLVPPSETWSPENDLLTAAMKLKRKPITNAHKEDIEKMYKK